MYELTINDLRVLGKRGGATARLLSGEEVTLRANYATQRRNAYVAGRKQEVEVILEYPKLYAQIRTIKRQGRLIAKRRTLKNGETALFSISERGLP